LAALAAILAAGCAGPQRVAFRPAAAPDAATLQSDAKGRVRVPPESGAAEVDLAVRGIGERTKTGAVEQRVLARLRVTNRGDATFRLDPAAVGLVDDDGREAVGAAVETGGPRQGPFEVAPGKTGQCELGLRLPAGSRFDRIGSLRLRWPYQYGDKSYKAETKFIRIEEVAYPPPAYYDPWYDPYYPYYPYRDPGWHWRFGMGYTFGR
jgi:hypothetical protein